MGIFGIVGQRTYSKEKDFYVYEWFIRDTGEIFYVGKGRGDRYKAPHEHSEWAEKIRREYDTGCRFLVEGVTEDEALLKETEEIKRVLDETTDILTNKVTPISAKRRGLWYKPCSDSPALEFEHAPSMYVTEIEKHYFDRKGRQFDPVNEALLQRPYLINDNVIDEINATVYHNEYERYYKEVVDALENKAGCKILSSKYAKSVTAWIYAGDISLAFYESTQEYLRNNYDRKIPCIHLMDVWKYLKATKQLFFQSISAQAITIQLSGEKGHNKRCAITEIRNYGDWQKGYEEGSSLCFEGDKAQKEGNLDKAIELFDKARYCGYIVPYLYECYAKTYRKMHDLQNEISILTEAVEQMKKQGLTNKAIKFENQKRKAENKVQ